MTDTNLAISYCVEELDNGPPLNIDAFLAEMDKVSVSAGASVTDSATVSQIIHYTDNCTVKDLLVVCDYYGFAKGLKSCKCTKEQIVECLVSFETDPTNADIVFKRQTAWFYIHELKQDKFMKKFVLW